VAGVLASSLSHARGARPRAYGDPGILLQRQIFFYLWPRLTRFEGVAPNAVGGSILRPSFSETFLGPLLLGALFDTVGRKPMIAVTYAAGGRADQLFSDFFFGPGPLDDGPADGWAGQSPFFFASGDGERRISDMLAKVLPLEMQGACHRALLRGRNGIGGIAAPGVARRLIEPARAARCCLAISLAAHSCLVCGRQTTALGIAAERRPLEEIAAPLSQLSAIRMRQRNWCRILRECRRAFVPGLAKSREETIAPHWKCSLRRRASHSLA